MGRKSSQSISVLTVSIRHAVLKPAPNIILRQRHVVLGDSGAYTHALDTGAQSLVTSAMDGHTLAAWVYTDTNRRKQVCTDMQSESRIEQGTRTLRVWGVISRKMSRFKPCSGGVGL